MVLRFRCAQEIRMSETVLSQPTPSAYQAITDKIVRAIEGGVGRFRLPWHTGVIPLAMPINAATEKPYRGINVVALWADGAAKGYVAGYWASYRQWQQLGAQVRRNERGAIVVFFKEMMRESEKEDQPERRQVVARIYRAFNAHQVDGWTFPVPKRMSAVELNQRIDGFVSATNAQIHHGGLGARYRHDIDCIELPERELFIGSTTSSPSESYYGVLLHELTHWSGAPHRLNRVFGKRFGDAAYAFEELVAELGSAFLCSRFEIRNEPRYDHATYLASWLDVLGRDTRAIFLAAGLAQRATDYLAAFSAADQTPVGQQPL